MQNFFREAPRCPFGTFSLCECRMYICPGGVQGHASEKFAIFHFYFNRLLESRVESQVSPSRVDSFSAYDSS